MARNVTRGWSLAAKLAYSSTVRIDLPGYKGVPCRTWLLPLDKDGYGSVWWQGGNEGAHRAAWIERHGSIPPGNCVCHHCDVRSCVEEEHLFLGSQGDNTRDRDRKKRQAFGERSGATSFTEGDIREICSDPRTMKEIAADRAVSANAIRLIKKRKSWKYLPVDENSVAITNERTGARGESNSHAKLLAKDVLAIRQMTGTSASIAKRFGVGITIISDIRRGRRWTHLQEQ